MAKEFPILFRYCTSASPTIGVSMSFTTKMRTDPCYGGNLYIILTCIMCIM